MSKMKLICPFICNEEEYVFCLGSDCALWVDDHNSSAEKDNGCCALACIGISHEMYPTVYKDPAIMERDDK